MVGVITTISIIGVAAGVASLILALAITNGMQRDLQKGLLSSTAQVQLMRVASDGIENWRSLTDRLRTSAACHRGGSGSLRPGIDFAWSPFRRRAGQRHSACRRAHRQQPAGRHQARQLRPRSRPKPVQDSTGTLPPLVLGSDLADTIGAGVGDSVLVTSPQGELTPFGLVPKYERFQVVGIFHSGFYQYDSSFALARLTDIQHLFGEPNIVSLISFKVDDHVSRRPHRQRN